MQDVIQAYNSNTILVSFNKISVNGEIENET